MPHRLDALGVLGYLLYATVPCVRFHAAERNIIEATHFSYVHHSSTDCRLLMAESFKFIFLHSEFSFKFTDYIVLSALFLMLPLIALVGL